VHKNNTNIVVERKSKLGHLEVVSSPLVKKLCENFESQEYSKDQSEIVWNQLPYNGSELNIIFSSASAFKVIESNQVPHKAIAFIKSALLSLDQYAISKLDKKNPSPFAIRDIMKGSALFHSTAFPLRHVFVPGKTIYQSIREIIFESVKDSGLNDSLDGAMMKTLKWIAYEKWDTESTKPLEPFGCPNCLENVATLPFDIEKGNCPSCGEEIFITDLFGLHLNMQEAYAPNQIASDYMSVAETLMVFSPIRHFWDNNREHLENSLMIKNGPLSLRATLSKLKAPIQRFFKFAKKSGHEVALIGYEYSGAFHEHMDLIMNDAPNGTVFIPDDIYIKSKIQHSNISSDRKYGQDTNYGAKVFIKFNSQHSLVLNIPTGERNENVDSPSMDKLIAFSNIVKTLPKVLSNRHSGSLLPVNLVKDIASLSTYPSAKVLELFTRFNNRRE